MQMAMRYLIPRILNTCVDFILDPSNMVMSDGLFNEAKVFISFSTTLKAVFNLAASPLLSKQFIQPGQSIQIHTDLDNLFKIAYTVFHQDNYTSHILVLNIRTQPTR